MEKTFTAEQRLKLDLLTKMSNIISNSVWMAENTNSAVEEKIDLGIWAAKHFIGEIEKENSKEPS
jgi:hypothetical protein